MKLSRLGCYCAACAAWGQPYAISTYAGGVAPPTPMPGSAASVGAVQGVATDGSGNVYFSSSLGCVFRLDASGNLTRYAGTCRPGFTAGDGGPAAGAEVYNPVGLAMDTAGNLYIADIYPSSRVRKASASGIITTVAGNGMTGVTNNVLATTTGLLLGSVQEPSGIAADASGNIYLAMPDGNCVAEVSGSTGMLSVFAGAGCRGGAAGFSGDGGPATSAQLRNPTGVAIDSAGNVYIADEGNARVRLVSPSGVISTIAGNGGFNSLGDNGPATSASFDASNVSLDAAGNLYITDSSSGRIRKVAPNGIITTVAGGGPGGTFAFGGDGGPATRASLNHPYGAVADSSGNLYIADQGNGRLRKVSPAGTITTVAGDGLAFSGDGGPATSAQLYFPSGVAVDAAGNLYIADNHNNRVRKVTPGGAITTVAGNGTRPSAVVTGPGLGDGGPATAAQVSPIGVAADAAGNLYIGDLANQRIRKISPDGTITTIAGTGQPGYSGDGGPATGAQLEGPGGVAVDSGGNVYFADSDNHRVRKISPDGTITTIAGTGQAGYSGDGGPATNAELNNPYFVALDSKGNLYIADVLGGRIRKVASDGTISTYAGGGAFQPATDNGDGGPATQAVIGPYGIAFDSSDNLYIADDANSEIRMVSAATGIITSVAGVAIFRGFPGSYLGDGGIATAAQLTSPQGVAIDSKGNVYIGDVIENAVRRLTPDPPAGLTIAGGNNQTGEAGWTLPYPLQVAVEGGAGVPVPGVTVNFAVTSGAASVAASAVTGANGVASVPLTLGAAAGSVAITASATGLASVAFNATTIAAPGASGVTCTLTAPPVITSINSASDFGGFSSFAAGSWLEIKGSNLAVDTRLWTGSDFQGPNAPTVLDGSSASFSGKAGFVDYISGGQINVQAPAGTAGPVAITVTTCAGSSQPFTVQEAPIMPGMLAPASFFVPGNPPELLASEQYMVALFGDGVTFVGNTGLIPGVPFRPAKPGDSITAYGIGFGSVTPSIPPGVTASQSNSISNLSIKFGEAPALVTYAGLAPNTVGLYQFDITVPQLDPGDYQIVITVGNVAVSQTLYLTVQ